jgi:MFS family permease
LAADSPSAIRARIAVAACFFVNGSVIGGWVPHVPDKARELGLNPAQLGAILLAGGCGATLAMPLAGWLTSKIGSKRVVVMGGCLMPLALTLAVIAPAPWIMAVGLLLLGLSGASMDVAMNSQGVVVEKQMGRRTISLFHGVWSMGGMLGSAATAAALSRGYKPALVVGVLAGLLIAIIGIMQRGLIQHAAEQSHGRQHMTRPHGRLLFLGMLAFSAMLSEGAVADWSGLYLRVVRHLGAGVVGYGYSAFAAAMVIGRVTGDRFVARVSELRALRYGGLLAACGTIVVLLTHGLLASLPGFALMGFGLSNVSPILYRSAGQVPGVAPGAAIATAVGIGYAGLLIGPPLLGVLGRATGVGSIFMVVTLLCLALSLASPVLRHVHAPE